MTSEALGGASLHCGTSGVTDHFAQVKYTTMLSHACAEHAALIDAVHHVLPRLCLCLCITRGMLLTRLDAHASCCKCTVMYVIGWQGSYYAPVTVIIPCLVYELPEYEHIKEDEVYPCFLSCPQNEPHGLKIARDIISTLNVPMLK